MESESTAEVALRKRGMLDRESEKGGCEAEEEIPEFLKLLKMHLYSGLRREKSVRKKEGGAGDG